MNARLEYKRIAVLALAFALSGPAWGQAFSSGSTGADGAFNPASNQTITARPGGVYNYTTVNIPANVTVTYVPGADNAPVVILATGDVSIGGSISVPGSQGAAPAFNVSGPRIAAAGGAGGFSGGNGGFPGVSAATVGHGPGGGLASQGAGGAGGSYGAPTVFGLIPLFGGSGGGGGQGVSSVAGGSGAGGGGAILIASTTRINIGGQIRANGGNAVTGSVACNSTGMAGAGSGGAIRLVAPQIIGGGNVQALPGTGTCATAPAQPGFGRIRMEAFSLTSFTGTTQPLPDLVNAPGPVSPLGDPALLNVPTLAINSIGGVAVPAGAVASYFTADIQLAPGTANPIPVALTATNTPVGSPTVITVRLMPQAGTLSNVVVPAADHTGTFETSTATVGVTFPVGQVSVIQAIAAMTLTGQTASLFPLIDGEPVERVMVAATPGERSKLSLRTRSGKEVRMDQLRPQDQIRVAQAWESMRTTRSE